MLKLRWKKAAALLVMFALIVVAAAGCAENKAEQSGNGSDGFPMVVKDDFGREVRIEKLPARIVSMSPANTETLFALGLGEKVVGVTSYDNYPAEAQAKEKIGGYADPSVEKIVALKPDLVLADSMNEKAVRELEKLNIPVVAVDPKNVQDVLKTIRLIGKMTGTAQAAAELAGGMERRLNAITEKVKNIPEQGKPRVYYEIWHEPIMTAGPGTFINDLITLAGGVNIAADAQTAYPEYSLELLVAKNPEVMIHTFNSGDTNVPTTEQIQQRRGWENLAFVKNGRIYLVDADLVSRPGPRIIDGLEAIAKAIHPELFE